jgi:hypothetical protein
MPKDLIKLIAKEYNTLQYSPQLINLLSIVYPTQSFSTLTKLQLHKKINDILITHYKGEQQLKYSLCKEFFNKKIVAAFEMRVNRSRTDFLTINGVSQSFEIKSGLDNLQKLNKQSMDYSRVFDYNYMVIHPKHLIKVEEIVPPNFGIWCFNGAKKIIHRDAQLNTKIDPEIQLRLLSKKEIKAGFKEYGDKRSQIIKDYTPSEINNTFKELLKNRYRNRWDFLIRHKESILPIDVQFFFNTNIEPAIIYNN